MARLLITTFNENRHNLGEAALFKKNGIASGFLTSDRTDELWSDAPEFLIEKKGQAGIGKVEHSAGARLFEFLGLSKQNGAGWVRLMSDKHRAEFRGWLASLYAKPVDCWVFGGHHSSNGSYDALCWGTEVRPATSWKPYAGFGIDVETRQLEWLGYRPSSSLPRDLAFPEAAQGLKSVRLMLILGCNGIPHPTDPGMAKVWRDYIVASGGTPPLILGWFGTQFMPREAFKRHACARFWSNVGNPKPGQTLEKLCRDEPGRVIDAWGKACHSTFHDAISPTGKDRDDQRRLWYRDFGPSLGIKGAGALAPDGSIYYANPKYGTGAEPVMVKIGTLP